MYHRKDNKWYVAVAVNEEIKGTKSRYGFVHEEKEKAVAETHTVGEYMPVGVLSPI